MIKIIFFDIDGTLLRFKTKVLTPKITATLNQLHANGIKLFIATGRPNFVVPAFEGVSFDGYLTFNGQYCYDKHGTIYQNPLRHEDVVRIIDNAKQLNHPVQIATQNTMVANGNEADLDEYFKIASQQVNVHPDFDQYVKKDVYQIMSAVKADNYGQLLNGVDNAKITVWWDKAVDIIPSNGGKHLGIEKILNHYHFTPNEAMAFGEGGNDIEMLDAVGLAVAMDNADNEVKSHADYICDSVDNDGIYHACKHFKLIN